MSLCKALQPWGAWGSQEATRGRPGGVSRAWAGSPETCTWSPSRFLKQQRPVGNSLTNCISVRPCSLPDLTRHGGWRCFLFQHALPCGARSAPPCFSEQQRSGRACACTSLLQTPAEAVAQGRLPCLRGGEGWGRVSPSPRGARGQQAARPGLVLPPSSVVLLGRDAWTRPAHPCGREGSRRVAECDPRNRGQVRGRGPARLSL